MGDVGNLFLKLSQGNLAKQFKKANIKVMVVKGFSRGQLLGLFLRAKAVGDLCMRGSERMTLKSLLHGAVFFTNACQTGEGKDDFPLSAKHRRVSVEGII